MLQSRRYWHSSSVRGCCSFDGRIQALQKSFAELSRGREGTGWGRGVGGTYQVYVEKVLLHHQGHDLQCPLSHTVGGCPPLDQDT